MKHLFLIALITLPFFAKSQNCNYAGTITQSTFIGQSNHVGPDTIFLCLGDSLLFVHNGDADLSGDPMPATPPGIAYALYNCPPTISGNTYPMVLQDPCLLNQPPSASGIYTTVGIPNGADTWFFNNGSIQASFGLGQPMQLYFAPITLDEINPPSGFEAPGIGQSPGPCVNVNLHETFSIVYLNEITAYQPNNHFGNDCIGKFNLKGGYPEFNSNATYTLDISLLSNPSIKPLLHIPDAALHHNATVLFSVTEPGVYAIYANDGKSCASKFIMDMSGCNSNDNLNISLDTVTTPPGTLVCVPVRAKNFKISSGAVSFFWNPALLQYHDITAIHPALASFFNPVTNINTSHINEGELGIVLYNLSDPGAVANVPDNDIVFSLCFEANDTLSGCAPIGIGPNPAVIAFENNLGLPLAVTPHAGAVCPGPQVSASEPTTFVKNLSPVPAKAGTKITLTATAAKTTAATLKILNSQGAFVAQQDASLFTGDNKLEVDTEHLAAGVYFLLLQTHDGSAAQACKILVYR